MWLTSWTRGQEATAPDATPPPRFATPPPQPTPIERQPFASDKRMDDETIRRYQEHPELREQAIEHDRQMQRDAAAHEQAERDYQAYEEDRKTRAERDEIVAEQRKANPFLDASDGEEASRSLERKTAVAAWVATFFLVLSLVGIVWWALTQRGNPPPSRQGNAPKGAAGGSPRPDRTLRR